MIKDALMIKILYFLNKIIFINKKGGDFINYYKVLFS